MSSGPMYQSLPGVVDPTQLCGDVSSGVVSTDWYTPSLYSYQDPYNTPYATSDTPQPWNSNRSSGIGASYALLQSISLDPDHSSSFVQQQQQPQQQHMQQSRPQSQIPQSQQQRRSGSQSQHVSPRQIPNSNLMQPAQSSKNVHRPASSQGLFESTSWAPTNALGIQFSNASGLSTPATSAFTPSMFPPYPHEEASGLVASSPELQQPKPGRPSPYTHIAPHPNIPSSIKRQRDDDDHRASISGGLGLGADTTPTGSSTKRRKRTASVISTELNDDDRFLVHLKEEENLPWKDIATRFLSDKNKTLQVAALQMRYKRLREKFRTWEDQDMNALKLAHEYWEKYKWEIISAKMLDFGVEERWPVRQCSKKWQELDAVATSHNTPLQNTSLNLGPRANSLAISTGPSILTPALTASQFSSPIEPTAPIQFSFIPMQ